jgi:hypothetical protein
MFKSRWLELDGYYDSYKKYEMAVAHGAEVRKFSRSFEAPVHLSFDCYA